MNYLQKKKLAFMSIVNQIKGFVRTISGVPPITLENCVDDKSVIDYKIYGNSVQDGEPSPDNPVEVVSVGEYDEETGKYKIPITASGKNLLDKDTLLKEGSFLKNHGVTITETGFKFSNPEYIPVKLYDVTEKVEPDKTYYIHRDRIRKTDDGTDYLITNGTSNSISGMIIIRVDGKDYVSNQYGNNVTFTTPSSYDTIQIYTYGISMPNTIKDYDETKTYSLEWKNVYLSEYSYESYEPYHEPITTNIYLDEPLRAIENYKDYINFESSKVFRKIIKVSNWLTKTNIVGSKTQNTTILLGANGARTIAQTLVYCPIFKGVYSTSNWTSSKENIKSHITKGTDKYAYYNIKYDRLGLVKENDIIYKVEDETKTALTNAQICALAREYFSSNFTEEECSIYVCDYKAPIEETIDLSNLPTFKGTTIYTIGTTIQPSNMEVTYYSTEKE